eukprot:TRINITY_DN7549_c0_g1_i1.p1 TRINITY_DN7549_c0_g1~~TRINITY_DN7549_c0_g1_i1.p1  ORF type:complete len:193 (+),score=33.32 TRINITY_DN7549_c0_g1_i1:70-648(+)
MATDSARADNTGGLTHGGDKTMETLMTELKFTPERVIKFGKAFDAFGVNCVSMFLQLSDAEREQLAKFIPAGFIHKIRSALSNEQSTEKNSKEEEPLEPHRMRVLEAEKEIERLSATAQCRLSSQQQQQQQQQQQARPAEEKREATRHLEELLNAPDMKIVVSKAVDQPWANGVTFRRIICRWRMLCQSGLI